MDDFQSLIWGINTIYSHGYNGSYSYARMWDTNAKLGEYLVPHSQYTNSPVGQGLQGRGIFLHILVLHDIRMNICTTIPWNVRLSYDKEL